MIDHNFTTPLIAFCHEAEKALSPDSTGDQSH